MARTATPSVTSTSGRPGLAIKARDEHVSAENDEVAEARGVPVLEPFVRENVTLVFELAGAKNAPEYEPDSYEDCTGRAAHHL
jgi:hypothetical protein